MDRSFDVLDTAAGNESAAGGLMNAGLGLGLGMNVGNQMAGVGANMNVNPSMQMAPPPLPTATQYYLAINGQSQGPYDANTVAMFINNRNVSAETLAWKQGMSGWEKIQMFPEFANYFNCPPPIPNI